MPSTKLIRKRIKAIGSTAKITGAMEMVAASKMKKAQDAAVQNRPYATTAFQVLCSLERDGKVNHPLLKPNLNKGKRLLVVVSSDKGLCGSYNAAVVREAIAFIKENPATDIISIGKKGQNLLSILGKNIVLSFNDFPIDPKERDAQPIAHQFIDDFIKNRYQDVTVCYTDFISTLKQATVIKQLLPLMPDEGETCDIKQPDFKFEPSPKEVINQIVPRIIETQFFQMILESIASEQSARMMAMKNATEAAEDLIEDLNLTYNSVRQGSITQELAEISAAVNSAK